MAKIIEAGDLPEGERVYLKKDSLGYRVVNPIKNEDGSTNWVNLFFGSKRMLIFLVVSILIAMWVYFAGMNLIGDYKEFYERVYGDPLTYCQDYFASLSKNSAPVELELTNLSIKGFD